MFLGTLDRSRSETRLGTLHAQVDALQSRLADSDSHALLHLFLRKLMPGRMALVSSFGSEAAVLLHMVSRVDPATPVIFLDTRKLFGETLRYRERLIERLGLTDVRTVRPDADALQREDREGMLWQRDPDRCCFLRKVAPLERALVPFAGWITGRKAYQGGARDRLRTIEAVDGRLKVNPLARWGKADIDAYFERHDLPRHPLEADGFLSIGCMPCTDRVAPGEDLRAGRWRHSAKSECGIHG